MFIGWVLLLVWAASSVTDGEGSLKMRKGPVTYRKELEKLREELAREKGSKATFAELFDNIDRRRFAAEEDARRAVEAERELRNRVQELEGEVVGVRESAEALRAKHAQDLDDLELARAHVEELMARTRELEEKMADYTDAREELSRSETDRKQVEFRLQRVAYALEQERHKTIPGRVWKYFTMHVERAGERTLLRLAVWIHRSHAALSSVFHSEKTSVTLSVVRTKARGLRERFGNTVFLIGRRVLLNCFWFQDWMKSTMLSSEVVARWSEFVMTRGSDITSRITSPGPSNLSFLRRIGFTPMWKGLHQDGISSLSWRSFQVGWR
mmetsp:Transcript_16651/g.34176  ORF Transcript_16651/g.34176 Transcript_16651/m.34176 type:complete len:326 (-) Transcript_16651:1233-2210(-)